MFRDVYITIVNYLKSHHKNMINENHSYYLVEVPISWRRSFRCLNFFFVAKWPKSRMHVTNIWMITNLFQLDISLCFANLLKIDMYTVSSCEAPNNRNNKGKFSMWQTSGHMRWNLDTVSPLHIYWLLVNTFDYAPFQQNGKLAKQQKMQ